MLHRFAIAIAISLLCGGCISEHEVAQVASLPKPAALERHCLVEVGPPRIEEPAPGLFVAIGYDLANTILVQTRDGNVVIDVSMSPVRAQEVRAALLARAPGVTRAIIYTHSHLDHIGGASVWFEDGTEIWATETFRDHLLKQYGVFSQAEAVRGARQFGRHVTAEDLPCHGLGARRDLDAALRPGIRMPTRTFSGSATFEIGGVSFVLIEAPGETRDQLFVWIPSRHALMPGDNFLTSFPPLYTIRGTEPRPVDAWIRSIDEMRRLQPEVLVPSHTRVRTGRDAIQTALRDYRDGMQWVRDEVVRRANRGEGLDEIVSEVGLPQHLSADPDLLQLAGQIDWSVRAIYTNQLGWFDGRPEELYPVPDAEAARREVEMMGGAERLFELALAAREQNDLRWALRLLARLARYQLLSGDRTPRLRSELADTLRRLATETVNTNGRSYLLESAYELEHPGEPLPRLRPDEKFLSEIPLRSLFEIMVTRLIPERALGVVEAVEFDFPESGERFFVTVRNGVAELAEGERLPGSPEPLAIVEGDGLAWRRLALGLTGPIEAVAAGDLHVSGSRTAFVAFLRRFQNNNTMVSK